MNDELLRTGPCDTGILASCRLEHRVAGLGVRANREHTMPNKANFLCSWPENEGRPENKANSRGRDCFVALLLAMTDRGFPCHCERFEEPRGNLQPRAGQRPASLGRKMQNKANQAGRPAPSAVAMGAPLRCAAPPRRLQMRAGWPLVKTREM